LRRPKLSTIKEVQRLEEEEEEEEEEEGEEGEEEEEGEEGEGGGEEEEEGEGGGGGEEEGEGGGGEEGEEEGEGGGGEGGEEEEKQQHTHNSMNCHMSIALYTPKICIKVVWNSSRFCLVIHLLKLSPHSDFNSLPTCQIIVTNPSEVTI
jgi:hypothetical protein